jgi:hypothetical protein
MWGYLRQVAVFAGKAGIACGIALGAYALLLPFDNLPGPFAPVREVMSVVSLLHQAGHNVVNGSGINGLSVLLPATGFFGTFFILMLFYPIVLGLRLVEILCLLQATWFLALAVLMLLRAVMQIGRRKRGMRAVTGQNIYGVAGDATEAQAKAALRGGGGLFGSRSKSADQQEF